MRTQLTATLLAVASAFVFEAGSTERTSVLADSATARLAQHVNQFGSEQDPSQLTLDAFLERCGLYVAALQEESVRSKNAVLSAEEREIARLQRIAHGRSIEAILNRAITRLGQREWRSGGDRIFALGQLVSAELGRLSVLIARSKSNAETASGSSTIPIVVDGGESSSWEDQYLWERMQAHTHAPFVGGGENERRVIELESCRLTLERGVVQLESLAPGAVQFSRVEVPIEELHGFVLGSVESDVLDREALRTVIEDPLDQTIAAAALLWVADRAETSITRVHELPLAGLAAQLAPAVQFASAGSAEGLFRAQLLDLPEVFDLSSSGLRFGVAEEDFIRFDPDGVQLHWELDNLEQTPSWILDSDAEVIGPDNSIEILFEGENAPGWRGSIRDFGVGLSGETIWVQPDDVESGEWIRFDRDRIREVHVRLGAERD